MSSPPRKTPARSRKQPAAAGREAHIPPAPARKRRHPQQERARQTVDAIVEAAAELLAKQGKHALTTNAVAERAGVSIGSLYQYFTDKESILDSLHVRHREDVLPLVHQTLARLADPSAELVETIVQLMRAMAALHARDPERMQALAREMREATTADEIETFTDATATLLAKRSGQTTSAVRAEAWLASMLLLPVGRMLVHQPPAADIERVLTLIGRMLRGLLSDVGD